MPCMRRQQIMDAVEGNQIVLIAGATGCGKSTQVPQYILEECWGAPQNLARTAEAHAYRALWHLATQTAMHCSCRQTSTVCTWLPPGTSPNLTGVQCRARRGL